MAESNSSTQTLSEQFSKFGTRTWNEINGLIFGRQEEK